MSFCIFNYDIYVVDGIIATTSRGVANLWLRSMWLLVNNNVVLPPEYKKSIIFVCIEVQLLKKASNSEITDHWSW